MSYRRSMEQLRPARTQKQNIQEKVQLFLTEADTSKATKAEMAICVAYNMNQNSISEADAVKMAGIEPKKWDSVNKPTRAVGKKTADTMPDVGSKLMHSGTVSSTNKYKKGTDTTSKADIVGNSANQISLKKQGDKGGVVCSSASTQAS